MKQTILLFALLAPLCAQQREFSITSLECRGLTCETREGIMPHRLTTVEFSGFTKEFAGYSLVLRVVNRKDGSVPIERKTGVMADGKFSAGIPAYTLPDGQYSFTVNSISPVKTLGGGSFSIAASGAAAKSDTPAPAQQAKGLAGHWYGIAGTSADLVLKADGTYISGGSAPGTWRQQDADVVFTGPLAAWNGGHGKLNAKGDVIEFYWTTPAGAKQYFVIGKY